MAIDVELVKAYELLAKVQPADTYFDPAFKRWFVPLAAGGGLPVMEVWGETEAEATARALALRRLILGGAWLRHMGQSGSTAEERASLLDQLEDVTRDA